MKVMKKENVKESTENYNYNQIQVFGGIESDQKRMKFGMKILFSFSIIVCCLFLFSCQNDDDYYSLGDVWISMGFIDQPVKGNSFTILLDDGDTLVPVSNAAPFFSTKDSQRVMVNYTVLDEVGQSTKKFYVKINNLYDILYKNIIELTPSNNDSIGNDPVHIDDIWKSDNKLNIEFSFLGGDVIHTINLVRPAGELSKLTQPIVLELRHNAKDDSQTYRLRSIVTFDLRNIKIVGQDSVSFVVKSTDYDKNEHTFNSTFYY
jgi:hypothetical protein